MKKIVIVKDGFFVIVSRVFFSKSIVSDLNLRLVVESPDAVLSFEFA